MKLNALLLLVAVVCFSLAACSTPEATAAAVTVAGATAAAIVDAVAPMLPPETLAKLQVSAASIDGTVQATATAVRTIADAIAQLRGGVGTQIADQAAALARATTQIAAMPSREEVYLVGAGTGAAGTAASRWLSTVKHRAHA